MKVLEKVYRCQHCGQVIFEGFIDGATKITIVCKNRTFTAPRRKCAYVNIVTK